MIVFILLLLSEFSPTGSTYPVNIINSLKTERSCTDSNKTGKALLFKVQSYIDREYGRSVWCYQNDRIFFEVYGTPRNPTETVYGYLYYAKQSHHPAIMPIAVTDIIFCCDIYGQTTAWRSYTPIYFTKILGGWNIHNAVMRFDYLGGAWKPQLCIRLVRVFLMDTLHQPVYALPGLGYPAFPVLPGEGSGGYFVPVVPGKGSGPYPPFVGRTTKRIAVGDVTRVSESLKEPDINISDKIIPTSPTVPPGGDEDTLIVGGDDDYNDIRSYHTRKSRQSPLPPEHPQPANYEHHRRMKREHKRDDNVSDEEIQEGNLHENNAKNPTSESDIQNISNMSEDPYVFMGSAGSISKSVETKDNKNGAVAFMDKIKTKFQSYNDVVEGFTGIGVYKAKTFMKFLAYFIPLTLIVLFIAIVAKIIVNSSKKDRSDQQALL